MIDLPIELKMFLQDEKYESIAAKYFQDQIFKDNIVEYLNDILDVFYEIANKNKLKYAKKYYWFWKAHLLFKDEESGNEIISMLNLSLIHI